MCSAARVGEKGVFVNGLLAARKQKTTTFCDGFLVAGIGFEPMTFGL